MNLMADEMINNFELLLGLLVSRRDIVRFARLLKDEVDREFSSSNRSSFLFDDIRNVKISIDKFIKEHS